MEITSREYKRCVVLRVAGRVDAQTAKVFEDAVQSHVTNGPAHIVMELDGMEYLSSAGVRVLITAQKALKPRGGSVILAQPSERVKEVIQMAGLDPLFAIYDDTVTAVGSV